MQPSANVYQEAATRISRFAGEPGIQRESCSGTAIPQDRRRRSRRARASPAPTLIGGPGSLVVGDTPRAARGDRHDPGPQLLLRVPHVHEGGLRWSTRVHTADEAEPRLHLIPGERFDTYVLRDRKKLQAPHGERRRDPVNALRPVPNSRRFDGPLPKCVPVDQRSGRSLECAERKRSGEK